VLAIWIATPPGCVTAERAEVGLVVDAPSGPVARGEFRKALLLTGELQAVRSIAIKSPQTATFQMRIQFLAEEGTVVQEGDPLLDFDNSSLAAQVRDLETSILDAETQIVSKQNELASALKDLEIEIAEREYADGWAELEASVDPDVLSAKEFSERQLEATKARRELEETRQRIELTRNRGRSELDVLAINRDKLQADLISAQEDLDRLSIKAPARGLVVYERRQGTTLRFQEGDSCWPGQGVLRLPDLSEMQVVFYVNEVDAPLLELDTPVRIELDSFPGRELSGRISVIPSMAVKRDDDSKIAVFKVVASITETWVDEMKPGMSVLGTVVLDHRTDVPLVARSSVHLAGEDYLFRVEGKGGASIVEEPIRPLARNETHYVVSEEDYDRLMAKTPKS
jgi:multidrug efflux pump subunit AcrA (membrane-fusion protein)